MQHGAHTVKDAEMQMLAKEWGEEGIEDCKAIRKNRVELLPENNDAAFVFSELRKVVRVDPNSGLFNDACVVLAAYLICFMHGISNPNETVHKVLSTFSEISQHNSETLQQESNKYVQ